MRAVFALLRTPVATEPKRSHKLGTRHREVRALSLGDRSLRAAQKRQSKTH
jgi:hypothetical protein